MKTVFVDTSGFYAFLDPSDPFHDQAHDCFLRAEREGWQLVTTNYVVHESWAIIQGRLGWEAVEAWRNRLVSRCKIVWVDEPLHAMGEARCRQARERRLSLTDCVSLEVMQRSGINEAVARDDHFERRGIRLP
jgi:predicted nucleic acid-binding protein